MNSWQVVSELGLVVEKPEKDEILVYGSSDPTPNPAELLMVQLISSYFDLDYRFFIYEHGKNFKFYYNDSKIEINVPKIFRLEDIIPPMLTLGEMCEQIWNLRKEAVIVMHLHENTKVRACSVPERKYSKDILDWTINDLHYLGAWLGGAGIEYILRLCAEKNSNILYVVPYQSKGLVFQIYRDFPRKLFVLSPFIKFVPPQKLSLPNWAPLPWDYWRSLPASYRKEVKKYLKQKMKVFFERKEVLRIEIPIP